MSKCIKLNEIYEDTLSWYANDDSFVWDSGSMTGYSRNDASFPPANVLDLHPKKLAKATPAYQDGLEMLDDLEMVDDLVMYSVADSVYLSVEVLGTADSLAIFNSNAVSAVISIVDKATGTPAVDPATGNVIEDYTVDLKGASTYEQLVTDKNLKNQREFFYIYPKLYASHIINILFRGTEDDGDVSTCGVVVAGESQNVDKLLQGLTQTFKDYSESRELNTGATYSIQRDMVRIFNLSFDQCYQDSSVQDLKDMFLSTGPHPIPWLIYGDNDEMWVVYARKNAELNNNFYAYNNVKSTFSLIEVL